MAWVVRSQLAEALDVAGGCDDGTLFQLYERNGRLWLSDANYPEDLTVDLGPIKEND